MFLSDMKCTWELNFNSILPMNGGSVSLLTSHAQLFVASIAIVWNRCNLGSWGSKAHAGNWA